MIDPDHFDPLAYVTAAAPTVGLQLSPERLATLAEAFALVVRVGAPALNMDVPDDAEPAPVFVA
jgi:hypothetical protein